VLLGAGRQRTEDEIDFAVGFSQIKKVGDRIEKNEPLLMVHARKQPDVEMVLPLLQKATVVG